MSIADPELDAAAPKRRRKSAAPEALATEPRSWTFDQAAAAPVHGAAAPLPGGGQAHFFADRVRARPAVAPQVSFMLGQNAIGLGLWGLFAPGSVNSFLGLTNSPEITRLAFGAREMATGVTLASDPTRASVLWARVAGDAFDIAVLSRLCGPENPKRGNARVALGVVLAVTALDLFAAVRMSTVKRNCV